MVIRSVHGNNKLSDRCLIVDNRYVLVTFYCIFSHRYHSFMCCEQSVKTYINMISYLQILAHVEGTSMYMYGCVRACMIDKSIIVLFRYRI